MYPVIEDYLESGLTQRVFCHERGLSMPVFAYWLAKYRRERPCERGRSDNGAFIELSGPPADRESAMAELVYPSGVRLRLFGSVEAKTLGELLSADVQ